MGFWKRFWLILRRAGIWAFAITLLSTLIEQFCTHQMEVELSSREGAGSLLWLYGGVTMILSLIQPTLVLVLSLASLGSQTLWQSLQSHWSSLLKETMRATGNAIAWGLLFLFPGLLRFLQLAFVPFIVLLDPQYQAGKLDALKESTRRVNQRFFQVLGLILLFVVIIPIATSGLDEWSIFSAHPGSALLITLVETLLTLLSILLLLRQWEKTNGTHV